MSDATTTTDKPGDPADKGIDQFVSHRAGYGDDKLSRLVAWLRAHPTTTLASGEGALLLGEIDRLRDDLHTQDGWVQWAKGEMDRMHAAAKDSMDHYTDARAEIDRLRRILAALREPSLALLFAGQQAYAIKIGEIYADEGHVARHHQTLAIDSAIRAAVKAAEQEVGRE